MKGGSHGGTAARVACLFLLLALAVAAANETRAGRVPGLQGAAALKQAQQAGIDIGRVIETVDHRVEAAKGRPGVLVSEDRLYRAEFGAKGFALVLRRSSSARSRNAFESSPAFALETARVLRGGRQLDVEHGAWRGERNSALRTIAPAIAERVTARAGELEWDFVLDRPPPGKGTLAIEASVSTSDAAARRERSSWAFAAGAGRKVAVGALAVIDAHGRTLYRASPGLRHRKLTLTVPARVLQSAHYPLTIDPVVSPEYPTSDPVYTASKGDQSAPALAFDGTNYLVVWQDARPGPNDPKNIYGTRVGPSGTVLDPSGIPISTAAADQAFPALAFDGTNYLVVWQDTRSGSTLDIYGTRVSPSGAVLDGAGIPISTAANAQAVPAVAFDGISTNYLVVWHDSRSGTSFDIYGSRVSMAGVVLDAGIPISTAVQNQFSPALALDGANYLVVWHDRRSGTDYDVYGARVSTSGAVLDPAGIAIMAAADDQSQPAVAFDGTNYLVAWRDLRAAYDVYGSRVSPAGTVLDPGGFAISTAANAQEQPALAFDGTNFLVAWRDYRSGTNYDLYGARVSPSAAVLDPAGIPLSTAAGTQAALRLCFDGSSYLLVWEDARPGANSQDVYGARVSPSGTVLDPTGVTISLAANEQASPAIGFDGSNYLVVWGDNRAGQYNGDLYGARVTPTGTLLDGTGIPISTTANSQGSPSLAFDGTNYLVTWAEIRSGQAATDVYGARVTPAGTVLDPGGFAIKLSAENPTVAFDGTNYLVVWDTGNFLFSCTLNSNHSANVYGARVSQAGTVLDPGGIAISTAANDQCAPAVSFDGTNYLVAWGDERSGNFDVFAARVSAAGSVLDPGGIAVSSRPQNQSEPALAFDGTNYLIVWQDYRSGTTYDIYGSRMSPGGAPLDGGGFAISTAPNTQDNPVLAFDGTYYFVAWQDELPGNTDIYGARVTRSAGVFDVGPLATTSADESYPALTRGPRVGLVYQRFAAEAPYEGVVRVFLRFVDRYRPGHDPPSVSSPASG